MDVIADTPVPSAALAVQEYGRQANRFALMQGSTCDPSDKSCQPYSTAWRVKTYAAFSEHRKDRRKPRYLADIVILPGDLEAAQPEALNEIRPQMSICGGRVKLER
jgi:hypothetical protein